MTKYMKIDDGPAVPYEPYEQLDIHGNVGPVTWDGEPMYSPSTVAEGLFDAAAFEQMPGQMAMPDECPGAILPWNQAGPFAVRPIRCASCRQDFWSNGNPYCDRCMAS